MKESTPRWHRSSYACTSYASSFRTSLPLQKHCTSIIASTKVLVNSDFARNESLLCKSGNGQISLTAVGQKHYDRLPVILRLVCQQRCRMKRRTGGNTCQNAFFFCKATYGKKCVILQYGKYTVLYGRIQGIGNESSANSLQPVRTGNTAR